MGLFGPVELTLGLVLIVLLAGFAAGWIDAVVGGGGLLQLPVVLLIPGLTPVEALATNKMGSVFGTATSAATYVRRVRPDLRTAAVCAVLALSASFGGAVVATVLPAAVIRPVILVALVGVAVFTALRPTLGQAQGLKHAGAAHVLRAGLIGVVIGFYDGVMGPGTGTFLVIALVTVLGYDFLQASAQAKIVNLATNLGALAFFLPGGHVVVGLGLLLGVANLTGGYVGARMAIARGTGFIRVVFLVVVFALIVRLSFELLGPLVGSAG